MDTGLGEGSARGAGGPAALEGAAPRRTRRDFAARFLLDRTRLAEHAMAGVRLGKLSRILAGAAARLFVVPRGLPPLFRGFRLSAECAAGALRRRRVAARYGGRAADRQLRRGGSRAG